MTTSKQIPMFSVVIPTHNHAHFLTACLNSVKNQTFTDYEVLLIDNGSTDNTKSVIDDFCWDKIQYYYQKDSGSVAGSRNAGIHLAKGQYVVFLDSDDLWYPDKLQRVHNLLQVDDSIDVLSHDLYMIRQDKEKKLIKCGTKDKNIFRAILLKNPILGSASVVRRAALLEVGGFDGNKNFVHAEDSELWLRIAALNKNFYFLNEALGEYRVHGSNLSNDFTCVLRNEKNVIKKHYKKLKNSYPFEGHILYVNRLSSIAFKMAVQLYFRKQITYCLIKLFESFLFNPFLFPLRIASLFRTHL